MNPKHSYQFSFHHGYVYIALKGHISVQDIIAASREMVEQPEYSPGIPEIWDISLADLSSVNHEELEQEAVGLETMWREIRANRIAVVSENTLNIGLASLFKELYGRDDIMIFEALTPAQLWVTR